jgi:hypothetical protein
MTTRFDELRTARSRALQVYLILIGAAHNRQILTYKVLSKKVGFGGSGVFAKIMYWCVEQRLPALTSLVVTEDSGLPGTGLTSTRNKDKERERVYAFDWYSIVPPTIEDLKQAYDRG